MRCVRILWVGVSVQSRARDAHYKNQWRETRTDAIAPLRAPEVHCTRFRFVLFIIFYRESYVKRILYNMPIMLYLYIQCELFLTGIGRYRIILLSR